jgi:hypothetical protein
MVRYFENRTDGRNNFKSPIRLENLKGITYKARTVNYNRNGLYIETDGLLQPGSVIYIVMEKSPYSDSTFHLPERYCAEIVWHADLEDAFYSYGYGVKYILDFHKQDLQSKSLKEANTDDKEMRKHSRKHYSRSVFFTSQNQYYEGVINNISRRGIFIETQDTFAVGQIIRLVVPGTKIDKGTMLRGEIRHWNRKGIGLEVKSILKAKPSFNLQIKKKSIYSEIRQNQY